MRSHAIPPGRVEVSPRSPRPTSTRVIGGRSPRARARRQLGARSDRGCERPLHSSESLDFEAESILRRVQDRRLFTELGFARLGWPLRSATKEPRFSASGCGDLER